MDAPKMPYAELRDKYLTPNGWEVQAPQPQDFWAEYDRIYVVKGDHSFPLQFKAEYNYLHIVQLFKSLDIKPPHNFQLYYDQQKALSTAKKAQQSKTPKTGIGEGEQNDNTSSENKESL
jgi:hypothetical protein